MNYNIPWEKTTARLRFLLGLKTRVDRVCDPENCRRIDASSDFFFFLKNFKYIKLGVVRMLEYIDSSCSHRKNVFRYYNIILLSQFFFFFLMYTRIRRWLTWFTVALHRNRMHLFSSYILVCYKIIIKIEVWVNILYYIIIHWNYSWIKYYTYVYVFAGYSSYTELYNRHE